jgi:hypothetical protein
MRTEKRYGANAGPLLNQPGFIGGETKSLKVLSWDGGQTQIA